MNKFATVAAGALMLSAVGCTGTSAKSPNASRPVDEGRAMKIIASAVQKAGFEPAAPHMVSINGGTKLRMDIAVQGHKFGFVYLSPEDVRALKGDVLAHKPKNAGNDLVVKLGDGDDADARVVLLYSDDYMFDDLTGPEHERTAIAAEGKLARDARDFLFIAKKNTWP